MKNIKFTPIIRVRKQYYKSKHGTETLTRYRFYTGRIYWNEKQMSNMKDGFKFTYADNMTAHDVIKVQSMWMKKLVKGGHLFFTTL